MKPVMANTLKNQVSTHTLLIYTKMLNWPYALSILSAALDFIDCTSKQNTLLHELYPISVIFLVFIKPKINGWKVKIWANYLTTTATR